MGTKRDLEAIEARRLQGARLLKRGVKQAQIAEQLGVSRQTVSRWAERLDLANGAVGKLKARALGRPGTKTRQQTHQPPVQLIIKRREGGARQVYAIRYPCSTPQ